MPLENNTILLVDGYAVIYRSFFAIRNLTNPDGEPVNALYGVARFSLKLAHDYPCSRSAVMLDKGKCARRITVLPDYKANRPSMPEELRAQIPLIRDWFTALGWPLCECEGLEADDLIAQAVERRQEQPVFIVSHDKDLAQLVQPDVRLLQSAKGGNWQQLGPEDVENKFGVPPHQIADYLALIGDSSDNIPGVPGVGPKTAAKLLRQFGDVDNLLANIERVESKSLREKLNAARDDLARNRELVRLEGDRENEWLGLDSLKTTPPDWERLLKIARRQQFKSLIKTLAEHQSEARNPRLF